MTALLDAALRYAALGWRVFPLVGKKPLPRSRGFLDATTDADTIARWWGANPAADIGVWCRGSGLIVVDVDGERGLTKLAELEAAHGPLPRTLLQRSGGKGGLHIVMRDPHYDPQRDLTELISDVNGNLGGPGVIDIKANGYFVAEPSAGGKYEWQAAEDWHNPPAVPEAWVPLLMRQPAVVSTASPLTMSGDLASRVAAARVELIARARVMPIERAELLMNVLAGGGGADCSTGNARVGRIAFSIGLEAPSIGADAALAIMRPALDEISRTAGSPHSSDVLEQRAIDSYVAGAREGADLEAARNEPLPGMAVPAGSSTFAAELTAALADVRAALGGNANTAGEREPLFAITARELVAMTFPATPWLVHGLITAGGLAAVATEPKSAKTWAATEIALGVATGTPVFGEFATGAPKSVAYFYAEDFGAQVRTRIAALCAGRHLSEAPGNFHAQPRGRFLSLTRDEDLAWIVASCRRIGKLDLLVLDPLRDVHDGEEDKSDDMSDVMRRMRLLGTLLDCVVLYVHHTAKQSADSGKRRPGQRMRGSGAIHGSTDSGIYLSGLVVNDDKTRFENTVQSEVKGARSAATFTLVLDIVDDAATCSAISATWKVVRDGGSAEAQPGHDPELLGEVLEAMALAAARKEKPLTAKKIRAITKSALPAVEATLGKALGDGLVDRNMCGKAQRGWKLTASGRALAEDDGHGG